MYAVQRTHLLRRDRDWLPASVRRSGQVVAGSVWGGAGLALVGLVIANPLAVVLWKTLALGGVGIAVVGERAGWFVFRRKLARLTRGEVPLDELKRRTEGELVCVRGRIDASAVVTGILHGTPGVYRRMVFQARGLWVHEAAVDFALVDDAGHRILVQAAGARWMCASRDRMLYPVARLLAEAVPGEVRERVTEAKVPAVDASERVLEVGALVQIVGYKTAAPDPEGEVTDYRSPPLRAVLASGDDLPLVITLLEDL